MSEGRLAGRVAVITGGASGIGAATARRLASEGAQVVIGDVQDGPGAWLAEDLGALYRRCDVTVEAQVAGLVDEAVARWGRLDVMFNNAGIAGVSGSLSEISVEDYDLTMNVLLRGVFLGIKHAAPVMSAQQSGSIINTASVCGLQAGVGNHIYTVAKAGVIMLTKTAALELAESRVRVNAVCPGLIATPLFVGTTLSDEGLVESEDRMERVREQARLAQPLPRVGEVDDIAAAVAWLASDESEWVTGTAQLVDGGYSVGKPWRSQPPVITEHHPPRR